MNKKVLSSQMIINISLIASVLLSVIIQLILGFALIHASQTNYLKGIEGYVNEKSFSCDYAYGDVFIPSYYKKISFYCDKNTAQSITVSKSNRTYYSKNNCVFERKTDKLIFACINSIIPKSTKSIDPNAFQGIPDKKLNVLYFQGDLNDWMDIEFIDYSPAEGFDRVIFLDDDNNEYEIEKISFGSKITRIDENRFVNFKSLKEIEFNNVEKIGSYAFKNCISLEELYIPDTVISIGYSVFNGCDGLKKISVPFMGEKLNSINNSYFGFIFNGEPNLRLPKSLKEVIIRNETIIKDEAFSNCTYLEKIEFTDGVKEIGANVFKNCSHLETIMLPKGINKISGEAFSNIELKNIYFKDTYAVFDSLYNPSDESYFVCDNFYEYVNGEYKLYTGER